MTVETTARGVVLPRIAHDASVRSTVASVAGCWSPSLSPDHRWIAFVSDRDGVPGVWVRRNRDLRELKVDTGPHPVSQVTWSRDGKWLALVLAPGGSPCTQVWVVRPDGRELQQVAPEADGAVFLGPWARGQLSFAQTTTRAAEGFAGLFDPRTGRRRILATGGQPVVQSITGDASRAIVRRGRRGERTLHVVDLDTGDELALYDEPGVADIGRLTPDGRTAYVRTTAERDLAALVAVELPPSLTGTAVELWRAEVAARTDAEVEDVHLTAGGSTAAVLWNCAGRSELELVDLGTDERSLVPLPEAVAHDFSFSRDGLWLATTMEGPTHPRAIWAIDVPTRHWQRVTQQQPDWTPPTAVPTLEKLRSSDGLEVTGWLYRADGPVPGPAVIHLHGGPEAQERPLYNPLFQALVQAGISVLAPNVRGSTGFGHAFENADNGPLRYGAIADVAACVDHLVARGIADPRRVAVAGRSYGGYLTLASLVWHPEKFAAGVDVCGMVDFASFYAHTEPWIAAAAYAKYGHPVDDAALLRDLSPLHRMDRLRAPLLVVHGANDTNVPVIEAEQTVAAARARGVPVDYLLFDNEGHELQSIANREIFVRRTVEWLVRMLRTDDHAKSA
jgi:dipeptidyl aminopeptidase/acylaminoacyl peptidase